MDELKETIRFLETHNAGSKPYPAPVELFKEIVEEHHGWFPIRIRALPEGSVIYPHVPVYTIEAEGKFSGLVTFLESLLTMVWYPSTVATLSRRCRDGIEGAFQVSVDEADAWKLESRLHDFGFRACTSVEQAIIGGMAHLLIFSGTDTLPAAYHAQYELNNGKPVASSIPASEHSVMMAHGSDFAAMTAIVEEFGSDVYSIVLDTWDYAEALSKDLPIIAEIVKEKGGHLVVRPDSGDPVEMTLMGLRALEKCFGSKVNGKGYRVINNAGLIFGDGLTVQKIKAILSGILEAGFSAECVAFGMGSNLLHKLNRDTMSFATKVCHEVHADGTGRNLFKRPKTDLSKASLPGKMTVTFSQTETGEKFPIVYPSEAAPSVDNLLELVYDHGPVRLATAARTFEQIKIDLANDWKRAPKKADVLSVEMKALSQSLI